MGTSAIVGIDAGTTAVKSVVFSPTGTVLGSARSGVRVNRPTHDRAEQDMNVVWSTAAETIRSALAEAGEVEVIAVSVTGQGDGAWLIDAVGRPTGPALLWLDGRGSARVDRWREDSRAEAVRQVTGSALFPGALPILLEEIEATDPDRIDRSSVHLNCKDWIRFNLTGEIATDPTEASRTYLDVGSGQYSRELLAEVGHDRFSRLLPPVQSSTCTAGRVTETAAALTGLPVGTPVATGMVDTPVGGIGLGITGPGHTYAIIGTTSFVGTIRDGVRSSSDLPVITLSFDGAGSVLECFAPMNGTPNLDWARDSLGLGDLAWSDIEELAAEAAPGSGGVVYLPYVGSSGERAPFVDTNASASWSNLSVSTTPAQMIRAVYEGIAQSLRECMDSLGVEPDATIRLSGGGARSATICRILADVTGRTIERSNDAELGARGTAALALVAIGRAPDITSAMEDLRTAVERFVPDHHVRELYDAQAEAFLATRDAMRAQWPSLRRLRAASCALAANTTESEPLRAATTNHDSL